MNDIEKKIEAILFLNGEAMTIKQIVKILEKKEEEIVLAINSLQNNLSERGIRLIKKDDSVMLVTAPEASDVTQKLIKEEFNSELTKVALETLSIIIYRGPTTRADIDYIRGVNSSFILRNLLIKGLIEKEVNPKDSRSFIYKPSFQLLQYLGVQSLNELPEYGNFNKKIENFIENIKGEQNADNGVDNI